MDLPSSERLASGDGRPRTERAVARDGIQEAEGKPPAQSEPRQPAAPYAEVDTKPPEPPTGSSQDPPLFTADFGTEGAKISDQAPQVQQADDLFAMAEGTKAFDSSAEEELIRNWPTLDKPAGGVLFHARRWPFFVATLTLVAGGSLYAMRIGPSRSRALGSSGSSCSASPAARAPAASVSPGIGADQGVAKQAAAPSVDQAAGVQPPTTPVAPQEQVAAPADAEAGPADTAEQESGGQPQEVSGETPSPAADDDQDQPPTLGAAPPATEGLDERCRKANAGGQGKPTVVLAACRPAIKAEPHAADIMVMLARADIDLGRAAEARSWAKKALRIRRDLPDAYVFLGGAEQEMGKPAEAKAAYQKYLELAPAGRHARELRAVLDRL